MVPPAAAPARARKIISVVKSGAIAAAATSSVSRTWQTRITRRLPSASPTGPKSGWMSAKGSAKEEASRATVPTGVVRSSAITATSGSVTLIISEVAKPVSANIAIRRRMD